MILAKTGSAWLQQLLKEHGGALTIVRELAFYLPGHGRVRIELDVPLGRPRV